jgi:hypothetical protein
MPDREAQAPARRRPDRRKHGRQLLVVTLAVAAVVIFLFPAFVAFRYTAASQRMEFVRQPWRGWAFAAAAVGVPGNSSLKTSGMALRKAGWSFKGSPVDPREVQLLYVPAHKPYSFTHSIGGRALTSTITPSYKFVWQVQGVIDTVPNSHDAIVGMLDYRTGRLLYDVRDDLLPSQLTPEPTTSPGASPAP